MQRSGWTRDVDNFLQWISAVPFSGGGFNDVAIAEGLSEALMVRMLIVNLLMLIFSGSYQLLHCTQLYSFGLCCFFFFLSRLLYLVTTI